MDCSMPGFPVHHQLPEPAQTHVYCISDAIQPSHPLLSPSPPAFNLSQHQGLFQWVSSLNQVAKVLEFCREPTHETLPMTRSWGRKPDRQGRSGFQGFQKGQLTRSHPWQVTRRKPDRQGRSGFQGFRKAAPGAHLKDICLSDACFNRLLPNFCDIGRRPSPISSQIRINLEL